MSFLVTLAKPLAYLSLPVFLCHTASQSSPIARYYIRLGLYLSSLGICSAWGVVVSIGMTIIGRRLDINWVIARSFYALAGTLLGIKFEVEGEENLTGEPTLMLGNHQSMLDILYLGRILPKRSSIIAKKELLWTPLLGQFLQLSGAVTVDRGNNNKAIRSLHVAGEIIKSRRSALWVFPEGTRTNKPEVDLLPFKKGAFHVAIQAGASITPVVCEHYYRLYHKGVFESGTLKLKVLPPVPTVGLTPADIPQLIETVRNQMLISLHEISGSQPSIDISSSSQTTIKQDQPESSTLTHVSQAKEQVITESTESTEPAQKEASGDVSPEESLYTSSVLGSDRGAETEEDDGMVLVDRPNQ